MTMSKAEVSEVTYLPESTSVFIVGASVFGLSSALHLAQAGYKHITVYDRASQIPGPLAASNDLNKIIRAEYGSGHAEDDFYTDLSLKALDAWRSTAWEKCYREVGYVRLAKSKERQKAIEADFKYFSAPKSEKSKWFPNTAFAKLGEAGDIQASVPQLRQVDFSSEWRGYLNSCAGYALASKAIHSAYERSVDLGVNFVLGPAGHITELISEKADQKTGEIVAIRSADGTVHRHPERKKRITILSLGAHLARLLPAAGHQITAKAWSVAHLELAVQEALLLQDIPVMNFSELGFWMEPLWSSWKDNIEKVALPNDKKSGEEGTYLLKLAAHGGGWTNFNQSCRGLQQHVSIPPQQLITSIPPEDEEKLRLLVKESLPSSLHDRPFVCKSICWCADTVDSEYIIDFVPGYKGLVLAGADSGHAFKMLPIAGEWTENLLKAGEQKVQRWKWKQSNNPGLDREDWKSITWRSGTVRDLSEVPGLENALQEMHTQDN